MRSSPVPTGPALLVVGHPGHELRVHGWLECARPVALVLTDGSGTTGASRLPSTAALLERAGATPGSIFGRLTDAELYRALLDHQMPLFIELAEAVADAIDRHQIAVVVGDDAEGYNPTHDVCRLIVDTAVAMAEAARGDRVANLAFALIDRPDRITRAGDVALSRIVLDKAAVRRKLDAAARYPEMAAEVAAARQAWGDAAFGIETFRHVPPGDVWTPGDRPPFYEQHGARRVAAGLYAEVIQYDRHIRPLARALAVRAKLQTQ